MTMIVSVECPSCATAFPVDPDKVPEGGARTECTVCESPFRVDPASWGDTDAEAPWAPSESGDPAFAGESFLTDESAPEEVAEGAAEAWGLEVEDESAPEEVAEGAAGPWGLEVEDESAPEEVAEGAAGPWGLEVEDESETEGVAEGAAGPWGLEVADESAPEEVAEGAAEAWGLEVEDESTPEEAAEGAAGPWGLEVEDESETEGVAEGAAEAWGLEVADESETEEAAEGAAGPWGLHVADESAPEEVAEGAAAGGGLDGGSEETEGGEWDAMAGLSGVAEFDPMDAVGKVDMPTGEEEVDEEEGAPADAVGLHSFDGAVDEPVDETVPAALEGEEALESPLDPPADATALDAGSDDGVRTGDLVTDQWAELMDGDAEDEVRISSDWSDEGGEAWVVEVDDGDGLVTGDFEVERLDTVEEHVRSAQEDPELTGPAEGVDPNSIPTSGADAFEDFLSGGETMLPEDALEAGGVGLDLQGEGEAGAQGEAGSEGETPVADDLGATFQFGRRDPHDKARRLARVLVSDMITYNPERHAQARRNGTIRGDFDEEIEKSWAEYVEQVGPELAESTDYWRDALNDILADGETLF